MPFELDDLFKELHTENVLGLASATGSMDEQEQGLRNMHLGNPDDVEPILRKRQYVLQVYVFCFLSFLIGLIRKELIKAVHLV